MIIVLFLKAVLKYSFRGGNGKIVRQNASPLEVGRFKTPLNDNTLFNRSTLIPLL